jgi:hypothetical protein
MGDLPEKAFSEKLFLPVKMVKIGNNEGNYFWIIILLWMCQLPAHLLVIFGVLLKSGIGIMPIGIKSIDYCYRAGLSTLPTEN